jgi:chemotaxis protein histidine kinase CheA
MEPAMNDVRSEIFDDHEVLHPPHLLVKALSTTGRAATMDLGAIARAEQALAALAVEFSAWMKNEIKVLDKARDIVRQCGKTQETLAALFRAAHDIKGEAATFGYPIAGQIAASLCRLLDELADREHVPLLLVDKHVDAIRAIVREDIKGEGDPTACALVQHLEDLVSKAVEKSNVAAAASR